MQQKLTELMNIRMDGVGGKNDDESFGLDCNFGLLSLLLLLAVLFREDLLSFSALLLGEGDGFGIFRKGG
jgi:hypothetical protein